MRPAPGGPDAASRPASAPINVAVVLAIWAGSLLPFLTWIWGALMAAAAVVVAVRGEVGLVGSIRRDTQPMLFWFVTLSWFAIGVVWAGVELASG